MISRLEAGYSQEVTGEVDLGTIVTDVVELYEPLAEEAGVELTLGEVAAARIAGNRELIGQALSNIVDNAIKYSAGAAGGAKVTVSLVRRDGTYRLGVADNGPGIPPEDRAPATERFVRLEKSRSQPGSGLGLSLAKAVMTFHGGGLDLSGREPGLLVEMVFPVKET
jgi:signal transduction histidine kinase